MMGVVYLAKDPDLGRDIALKVIQLPPGASEQERSSFEQRFFSEAQSAARLTHPGIVIVHDVGRDAVTGPQRSEEPVTMGAGFGSGRRRSAAEVAA